MPQTLMKSSELPRPKVNDFPNTGEFMLADAVWVALQNANLNFLAKDVDPQYASPKAYTDALIAYAQTFTQNKFPIPYVPVGWDAVKAATDAANDCFEKMKQIAVNINDPNSWSVYDSWIIGTGQLYGGHA